MSKIKSKKLKKIIAEEYRRIRKQSLIAKIIKEEYKNVRKLMEDSNEDTFEMLEVIVDALGAEETLDNVIKGLERSVAQETLQHIIRMYEIPWSPEEGYAPTRDVNEETKPDEEDRKPSDTPEDRIRK